MRRRNQPGRDARRRGMVAVYVALALVPILGIVAMVIDIGIIRDRQRHVQAAVDAASLAAAVELFHNTTSVNRGNADPGGAGRAAALENLKANGYTDDNSEITIHIPPEHSQSGFNGQLGYAEVIINFKQRRYFSAIFGSEDILVGGRGIARGVVHNAGVGVVALDRHKDKAFEAKGNGGIEVRGGSIYVNSDSDNAHMMNGNSTVEAISHEITGNRGQSGNANLIGPVHTGVPPIADPMRHLPEPDPADYPVRATSTTRINGNDSAVLLPGVYEGGLKISGNGSATLMAGIHIMRNGGFEFSGNGELLGSGVLIFVMTGNSGAGIKITGNGSVNLTPPLTGPYQGVGLFQQRSQTDVVQISGNGGLQISGLVYAAAAEMKATGNGSNDVFGGSIIVNSLFVSGNGNVLVNTGSAPGVVRDMVRLVE